MSPRPEQEYRPQAQGPLYRTRPAPLLETLPFVHVASSCARTGLLPDGLRRLARGLDLQASVVEFRFELPALVLALEADLDLIAIPPDDVGPPVPRRAGLDEGDPAALLPNLDRARVAEAVRAALHVPELLAGLDLETTVGGLRVEPPLLVFAQELDLDRVRGPLSYLGAPPLVRPDVQ